MSYELTLEQFQGPLEKLLELIEERKLDINEVSLANVTDDFLGYLSLLEAEVAHANDGISAQHPKEVMRGLRLVADFVAVASKLLLLKSKSLLPEFSLTEDEETDIADLKRRLARYRELKRVEKHIAGLWRNGKRTWSRPYFLHLASSSPVFYPAKNMDLGGLRAALGKLLEALLRFTYESGTVREAIISLEGKMKEVIERIREIAETTLGTLSRERSRAEVIALFLAILHLAREELVMLEQQNAFSDIIIRKRPEKT